jgi:peptidoglycan/xylan/chitin deacetylase (PgdA/CDA1 family)
MSLRNSLYRKKEKLVRRLRSRWERKCHVLLYHRISNLSYDPQQLCVHQDIFYDQLRLLKQKGDFLRVDHFHDCLTGVSRFPHQSFLVTFDDGYEDNLTQALPVLEALGIQAVFYVSTALIGSTKMFWWDELDLILKKAVEKHGKPLLSPVEYDRLINGLKTAKSITDREEIMTSIRSAHGTVEHDPSYRILTIEQLKSLSHSKCAVVGAHSVNHLSLGHLNVEEQIFEIRNSIETLSAMAGYPVKHFAFPYGTASDFNQMTMEICREAGMSSAAANIPGPAKTESDGNRSGRFAFPRQLIRNVVAKELLKNLHE